MTTIRSLSLSLGLQPRLLFRSGAADRIEWNLVSSNSEFLEGSAGEDLRIGLRERVDPFSIPGERVARSRGKLTSVLFDCSAVGEYQRGGRKVGGVAMRHHPTGRGHPSHGVLVQGRGRSTTVHVSATFVNCTNNNFRDLLLRPNLREEEGEEEEEEKCLEESRRYALHPTGPRYKRY